MQQEDIIKYCNVMREIKRRTVVINAFGSGGAAALYQTTTIESVYLQLRKILELIAFSSLVANKNEFSKVYADFAKCWNGQYLLRDIERVNPHFYPCPIVEVPAKQPGVKMEWQDKKDGFLTKEKFLKLYEKCGAIMHAGRVASRLRLLRAERPRLVRQDPRTSEFSYDSVGQRSKPLPAPHEGRPRR